MDRRRFLTGVSAIAAAAYLPGAKAAALLGSADATYTFASQSIGAGHGTTYHIFRVANKLTGALDIYASAKSDPLPPPGYYIIGHAGIILRDGPGKIPR
jgi:hypothetical protein